LLTVKTTQQTTNSVVQYSAVTRMPVERYVKICSSHTRILDSKLITCQ